MYLLRAYHGAAFITFRLNVDRIGAERVLVDHAVDAAVAPSSGMKRPFVAVAAVPHREKQTDNQPLEKARPRRHRFDRENAVQEIIAKRRSKFFGCRYDALVWWQWCGRYFTGSQALAVRRLRTIFAGHVPPLLKFQKFRSGSIRVS